MWAVLRNRRVWLAAAVIAGLLALALWPRAVEVDVATVTRGPLTVTVDEEGETRVRERFEINAPVPGELTRISLEPGDRVEAGRTVVAVVRPAPPPPLDARAVAEAQANMEAMEAAVARLRAEHDRAVTALTRARQLLERARGLFVGGAIAQDELDAREAEVRQAEEAVRAARFAVAQVQQDLNAARARLIQQRTGKGGRDVVMISPIDGVVLKRYRESESVVPAGEHLLDIGDRNQLEIVADYLSADAVKVRPGQRVLIEQWGGGQTLHGHVRRVEPSGFMKVSALGVEEQRVNIIIDLDDPEQAWRALGDGYRVEVRVEIWQQEKVLKVPTGSLFRRGQEWALFVIDGGRARLRTVQVGPQSGAEVQVTSGLREGERLVLYPPDTLADGTRVEPRTNGGQSAAATP
jgi:HlyD family secretion protein